MLKLTAALALSLLATSAFAQQTDKYNPGTVQQNAPAAQQESDAKPDPVAEAQKRFGDWKTRKRDCYLKAGLVENKLFKLNPENDQQYLVSDYVWLHPDKFDANAVKACVALK